MSQDSLLERIKKSDESVCTIHFVVKLFLSNYFQGLCTSSVSSSATTWYVYENIVNSASGTLTSSTTPPTTTSSTTPPTPLTSHGHRWRECDSSFIRLVLNKFTNDLTDLLIADSNSLTTEKIQEIRQLTLKMRSVQFCQKLINELGELAYIDNFNARLDNNSRLMCFANGIFDFAIKQFRCGGSKKCDKMIYFITFLRLLQWRILIKPTENTIKMSHFI